MGDGGYGREYTKMYENNLVWVGAYEKMISITSYQQWDWNDDGQLYVSGCFIELLF